jgi:hypothetical protein
MVAEVYEEAILRGYLSARRDAVCTYQVVSIVAAQALEEAQALPGRLRRHRLRPRPGVRQISRGLAPSSFNGSYQDQRFPVPSKPVDGRIFTNETL